jgi:hypothetical protein
LVWGSYLWLGFESLNPSLGLQGLCTLNIVKISNLEILYLIELVKAVIVVIEVVTHTRGLDSNGI